MEDRRYKDRRDYYPLSSFAKNDSWGGKSAVNEDERIRQGWKQYLNNMSSKTDNRSSLSKNSDWDREPRTKEEKEMLMGWRQYLRDMSSKNDGSSSCSVCGVGVDTDGYCKNDRCSEWSHKQCTCERSVMQKHRTEVRATGSMAPHSNSCNHHHERRGHCENSRCNDPRSRSHSRGREESNWRMPSHAYGRDGYEGRHRERSLSADRHQRRGTSAERLGHNARHWGRYGSEGYSHDAKSSSSERGGSDGPYGYEYNKGTRFFAPPYGFPHHRKQ